MSNEELAHPQIVSRDEWLLARKAHLAREKEVTKERDRLHAERRRLPMVRIEKQYAFDGIEGKSSLLDLFGGRRQLMIYHFMFDPDWDEGCPACTSFINQLGSIKDLNDRDVSFLLISRAPLPKLEKYRARKGWKYPWVSSFGTDFNYDFHVTQDEKVAPLAHNYRDQAELEARAEEEPYYMKGEQHGMSVFLRVGDKVFHTYSAYARGTEPTINSYNFLDMTPYARQEDWEDSPAGWPQKPTYG